MKLHLCQNDQQVGPLSEEDVQGMLADGVLTPPKLRSGTKDYFNRRRLNWC